MQLFKRSSRFLIKVLEIVQNFIKKVIFTKADLSLTRLIFLMVSAVSRQAVTLESNLKQQPPFAAPN